MSRVYKSLPLIFFFVHITLAIHCNRKFREKPNDPLFARQWYLHNKKYPGEDINWLPVYNAKITGKGVHITIVGDGFDTEHPDLVQNGHSTSQARSTLGNSDHDHFVPKRNIGIHGTPMAGLVAAICNNGIGICGAASGAELLYNDLLLIPDGKKNGLQRLITSIESDAAFSDISINSWGGEDFTGQYQSLDRSGSMQWQTAMENALKTGRNGKGTIFIWSAGNGTQVPYREIDNSNYDEQTNFYGVMAVCAVDKKGMRASYSERGANLWVCAPSSSAMGLNSDEMITTNVHTNRRLSNSVGSTALPDQDYTSRFGGTSAAAALVGVVVALMLEVNPDLTWRDVKIILAESARKNDPNDSEWQFNGGQKIIKENSKETRYHISEKYGFGAVDAEKAVSLARKWVNVPSLVIYETKQTYADHKIYASDFQSSVEIHYSGIYFIEYVDIFISSKMVDSGSMTISLISPSGTKSVLQGPHDCLKNLKKVPCVIPSKWRYGSARQLGESPNGVWQLMVANASNPGSIYVKNWSMKIYGH